MTWLYRYDVWGFDYRGLQVRAYWFSDSRTWSLHKDTWCWYLSVGPFLISGHRHHLWG